MLEIREEEDSRWMIDDLTIVMEWLINDGLDILDLVWGFQGYGIIIQVILFERYYGAQGRYDLRFLGATSA